MDVTILVYDSVVKLPPEADGAVVIGGSHAAAYAAYMSAKFGCRAAIHHDAGIGKDEAGVSRLPALDARGIPAATVSAASARIGDARSTYEDGIVSRVNACAMALGLGEGISAKDFVAGLRRALAS